MAIRSPLRCAGGHGGSQPRGDPAVRASSSGTLPCLTWGVPDPAEIDDRIDRASARPFGRRFHLRGRERATAELQGPQTMRVHAAQIVAERLAPAEPRNDGRQTPYRNHPVFVAQHATATCCRSCLETWHGIAKGHRLDRSQRAYLVEVIGRWIDRELASSGEGRDAGSTTSHRS